MTNITIHKALFTGLLPLFLVLCTLEVAANKEVVKTVVIDAGHGGKDPGCSGVKSKEKHVALSIALKVGSYIEKNFPTVKVIYTRKTDVFIELHERAKIANRNNADLFISIHCNANGSTQPYGTETYVMGLHKSNDNLGVAKRENASVLLEDNYTTHYDGFDPNSAEAHIMFSLFQNAYLDQSISLASKIQTQFKERAKRRSRGVHQAGFLVLYRTSMPSVLVETGFLTNRTEEKYLASESGQTYVASAIYRAFKEFKYELEGVPLPVEVAEEVEEEIKDTVKVEVTVPVKQEEEKVKEVDTKPELVAAAKGADIISEEKTAEADPNKLIFKIQFLTSAAPLEPTSEEFKGVTDITSTIKDGRVKYMAGKYSTLQEAATRQQALKEIGFSDAFIVVLRNGKRVPMSEVTGNE